MKTNLDLGELDTISGVEGLLGPESLFTLGEERKKGRSRVLSEVAKAKESAKLSTGTATKIDKLLKDNKFEEAQALLDEEVGTSETRRASVLSASSGRIGKKSNAALSNIASSQPLNSIL